MLDFENIKQPRIDIELYGTDTHIPPLKKVQMMDDVSFEQFIVEWLYGCKKHLYSSIQRLGGSGDKGRDIIGRYKNGDVDYYQCKHYNSALTPSDYYIELGKLCFYTYRNAISIPKVYYIVASNDVGPSLQKMIDNPTVIPTELKKHWDKHCKSKITKGEAISLDSSLIEYIDTFDFSIVKTCPISSVIDEHLNTKYGILRFGGKTLRLPEASGINEEPESSEMQMNYVLALLDAYSDECKAPITSIEGLKLYKLPTGSCCYNHFLRQRKDYYHAETMRCFVRDTFTDSQQFDILKEEIHSGIIETHEQVYNSGYMRLVADLAQAVQVNTSKSLLDSRFHCIGNEERKGICHILADDNILKWVVCNDASL